MVSEGQRNPASSLTSGLSSRSIRERQAARRRRVRRLIDLIKRIKDGGNPGESEIIRIQLFPKDYIELLVEVDEQDSDFQYYFNNILRYDYRESRYGKSQFTIFMKSVFHACMERAIDEEVRRSITQVQGHRDIVKRIKATGDAPIEVGDKTLHPDCSFRFRRIRRPPIVFEVAWSQESDDLKAKAVEFLRETKGQVRTVVGFDFKGTFDTWKIIQENVGTERLPNRGPARAFIWRATFDENGQQLFGDNGQPILDKKNYRICDNDEKAYARPKRLQLSLRDFTPKEAVLTDELDEQALDDVKLGIDPEDIIRHFDAALEFYKEDRELKEPKIIKQDEESKRVKEEREAERAAAAEREHKKWTILDVVNVGRFNLRGSVRRDRPAGGAGREGGAV
ncbi:hypothetical protein F5Y01DRAFT_310062 [Xylaria sp. FL0043]|nr:hypothetical protein F5Y01DRAFT_310062 [Xylaria sp. FL0043]